MADKVTRPKLDDLDLSLGKMTRLHRLLFEHGPVDFFAIPISHRP